MMHKNAYFIFAGEQSGDQLGAELIEALKKQNRDLVFQGVGGKHMRAAGLSCIIPMEKFQVMGFSGVLQALPRLFFLFRKIVKTIIANAPEKVILIDYADFNMLLAKALRKKDYKGKIIHYVSPSVWAWRKKRIFSLAKHVDLLLSILPFEKEHYAKTTLPVIYVGHPLVKYAQSPTKARSMQIAIFPGSRREQLLLNLPLQIEVAKIYARKNPECSFAISCARKDLEDDIRAILKNFNAKIVASEERYALMQESAAALATSGTITLECALHELPTVITYRVSFFNGFLGKYCFRISLPHFSLPNLILGREVFPEFIHYQLAPHELAFALEKLIEEKEACQKKCLEMKEILGSRDASAKAAEAILYYLPTETS